MCAEVRVVLVCLSICERDPAVEFGVLTVVRGGDFDLVDDHIYWPFDTDCSPLVKDCGFERHLLFIVVFRNCL